MTHALPLPRRQAEPDCSSSRTRESFEDQVEHADRLRRP